MMFKTISLAGLVLATTTVTTGAPAFAATQTAPRVVTQNDPDPSSASNVRPRRREETRVIIIPGEAPRDTGPDIPGYLIGWVTGPVNDEPIGFDRVTGLIDEVPIPND